MRPFRGLSVKVHLVDGTYELFRSYFGAPPASAPDGRPVGAVRGFVQSMLLLLRQESVTHMACAFDHVIESFRNELYEGYKTGQGVPQDLIAQFGLAERAMRSLGVVVWPMVEFEADDAIATAAARWQDSDGVEQVVVCSPDKDLAQMVRGSRVVTLDRRKNTVLDQNAVREKFGVSPESIPDYLALVGDSADGIPGIPRWGAKSTSHVLERYLYLERIPPDASEWSVTPRGAASMAASLNERRADAMLYKELTTLRLDVPLTEDLEDLHWKGVRRNEFLTLCDELGFARIKGLPHRWTDGPQ